MRVAHYHRRMEQIWNRLNVDLLFTDFVAWLPRLFAAVLLMTFFWGLFRVSRATLSRVLAHTGFDHALIGMLLNVYRFALMTFGIVMAAGQLGINVGAALAGLGVVGLTIGFAAKDTLRAAARIRTHNWSFFCHKGCRKNKNSQLVVFLS